MCTLSHYFHAQKYVIGHIYAESNWKSKVCSYTNTDYAKYEHTSKQYCISTSNEIYNIYIKYIIFVVKIIFPVVLG